MPRFRIDIEYDGRPYAGWQRQAGQPSVQEAIEKAIAAFSGEEVTLRGAGRTDAGVHALGQVAHFDLSRGWKADTVRDALNAHLGMEHFGSGARRNQALRGPEAEDVVVGAGIA